ncbi:ABC transporter permease [Leifsonia sp. ZF2019]|uniref:ABC transporter permease n=1 Tax=Leifsonia sp. ZF2019 TaxID=2781978 RepID=UPI001CBB9220|nr:ABC transporter permease [Leifsonia sp. ZF2019]UAJ81305.1 ABC transporter permease [Leifsonia sp. ZF2019]
MFVALRDLRFARGRFLLIGSVVALITLLVGFLSGLTGGLATQNVSAVLSLPGDRLVFSAPGSGDSGATFAGSAVTAGQQRAWSAREGVRSVAPIGISQSRAGRGNTRAAVALFGQTANGATSAPDRDGTVTLSTGAAAALDARVGDRLRIGGRDYTVAEVGGDDWYSHTPVVRMTLADWQSSAAATGAPDAYATVLAVSGNPDWAASDAATGTVSESIIGSLTALSSFRSEIGSLLLMIALLFGISGLVVGAFFTVWTLQRAGDIAVLKALGAGTGTLIRDALGQALVVLVLGIGVGLALVAGPGALAGGALPFLLSPLTTLVPGAILVVLGLAGAAFALRSVTSADPLTALGSNR